MMKKIILTLAVMAALVSCAKDIVPGNGGESTLTADGRVSINFSATIPSRPIVATKGVIGDDISDIEGLTVAVFGPSGYLLEQAEAVPVNNGTTAQADGNGVYHFVPDNNGVYHFNVTLKATDGETHVHFIAGAHERIDPSGTEGNIMGNLLTKAVIKNGKITFPDAYWNRLVIMDGIHGPEQDDSGNTIPGTTFPEGNGSLVLIRNSAKISVRLPRGTTEDPDPNGVISKFSITGYELVRVPKNTHTALYHNNQFLDNYQNMDYMAVKNFYDGDGWTNPEYVETILSDQNGSTGDLGDDSGKPNVVIDKNSYKDANPKFMYQRSVVSAASTYLIVKGQYTDNSISPATTSTCYYKINLADENDNLMPLYRNFHYEYIIKDIKAKGEPTPYQASQSNGSGGITVGVVTRYDTSEPVGNDGDYLYLEWSENTYTHDDYITASSSDNQKYDELQVSYNVKVGSDFTNQNQKIYLKDAKGRIFWAGNESGESLYSDSAVAGEVPLDETVTREDLVFYKASVTGQNIRIFFNDPGNGRHKEQPFYVCVGEVYREVKVHSIGQLEVGITALNNIEGDSGSGSNTVPVGIGKDVEVKVLLNQGLPSSIFPMELDIYVNNNSLSPVAGSDIAVGIGSGTNNTNSTNGTYYFKKILSHDDYQDNSKCPIENGKVTVPLQFKTSKENSGSGVGVHVNKAHDAWTEFYNPSVNGTFSNVKFTGYESAEPGVDVPLTLSFSTSGITTVDVVLAPGLEPANGYMTELTDAAKLSELNMSQYPDGSRAYTIYSVSTGTHSVALKTTSLGDVTAYVASSSTGYSSQELTARTASLTAVQETSPSENINVIVNFASATFSNNTFSDTASGLTVALSKAAGTSSYNMTNTYTGNKKNKKYEECDYIQFSSESYPITAMSFTLTSSQLGLAATNGTLSNATVNELSPSWSGSANSITIKTLEHGTSYENMSNVVSSVNVTLQKPARGPHYE